MVNLEPKYEFTFGLYEKYIKFMAHLRHSLFAQNDQMCTK